MIWNGANVENVIVTVITTRYKMCTWDNHHCSISNKSVQTIWRSIYVQNQIESHIIFIIGWDTYRLFSSLELNYDFQSVYMPFFALRNMPRIDSTFNFFYCIYKCLYRNYHFRSIYLEKGATADCFGTFLSPNLAKNEKIKFVL